MNEHFEVIKSVRTQWADYGDMDKIEIPAGCTHVMIDNARVKHGYYWDVDYVEVDVIFGKYNKTN